MKYIQPILSAVAEAINETPDMRIDDLPIVTAHYDPTVQSIIVKATDMLVDDMGPGDETTTVLAILRLERVRVVMQRARPGIGGGADWTGRQVTIPAGIEIETIKTDEWGHDR